MGNTAAAVADSIASPRNERVEQARQVLQSEVVQEASEEDKPSTPTTTMSLEERVERAKRLLADKQAQKTKEEIEKSKDQESERREMEVVEEVVTTPEEPKIEGKSVAGNKKKNEDAEFRKAAEERQKDKEESRLALIKIKEQIAQDRAERSDKFKNEKLEREEKLKDQEMLKLAEEAKKAEQVAI